jgi:peptide/nickel transport system permease protein
MFSQNPSSRQSKGFGSGAAAILLVAVMLLLACASALAPLAADGAAPGQVVVGVISLAQDEPVANAGLQQNVTVGSTVMLNASLSTGFEGASGLNYTWYVDYRNFSDAATFSPFVDLYGVTATFIANQTGVYRANLTVKDSQNRTSYDELSIIVREKPPTWLESHLLAIILGAISGVILVWVLVFVTRRLVKGDPIISEAGREKAGLVRKRSMKVIRQLLKNPMGLIGIIILAVFIFIAAFGPLLAPYEVSQIHPENKIKLPSKDHIMGTDNFGKDIWSELLHGARTSMIVGVVSAMIASFLGAAVGLYSGYVGGWKDEVAMRLNDIVLSIPWLVLMIVIAAMIGEIDLTGIILIIGLTGWSTTARMVRAQVLSVRERQYIERARCIGASDLAIIRRHIFPNTFPLVFANTILTVAVSILSEATLSFLGFRPIGIVTWGTMLSFASDSSAFQIGLYWWILAPGFCIVLVVLGFTLLGYALDEILNPKLRHR